MSQFRQHCRGGSLRLIPENRRSQQVSCGGPTGRCHVQQQDSIVAAEQNEIRDPYIRDSRILRAVPSPLHQIFGQNVGLESLHRVSAQESDQRRRRRVEDYRVRLSVIGHQFTTSPACINPEARTPALRKSRDHRPRSGFVTGPDRDPERRPEGSDRLPRSNG